MTIETTEFGPVEFLGREEAQAELLADAFASGDPKYIKVALEAVVRARGMSRVDLNG